MRAGSRYPVLNANSLRKLVVRRPGVADDLRAIDVAEADRDELDLVVHDTAVLSGVGMQAEAYEAFRPDPVLNRSEDVRAMSLNLPDGRRWHE